jgi:hypothetical protein
MLMRHPRMTRENLPVVLEVGRKLTLGSAQSVLDHKRMNPEGVAPAMRVMLSLGGSFEGKGYTKVMEMLSHPKVDAETSHRFMEAADRYGYLRAVQFMNKNGVDSSNILERMHEHEKKVLEPPKEEK